MTAGIFSIHNEGGDTHTHLKGLLFAFHDNDEFEYYYDNNNPMYNTKVFAG